MKNIRISALGLLSMGLVLSAGAWAHSHGAMQMGADAPTGHPASATVSASDCWIRQLPAPAPSGGFLVVHNAGDQTATLTGVHSSDYGMAMMHETTTSGGMSKMSMVHEVEVPAGGDRAFAPGGYHLMLEQPRDGLKVGDHVGVDFTLGNGDGVHVSCEIKPASAMPAAGAHDHKHSH